MSKKQEQLGMNPSTAQHRLLKDILWDFILQTGKSSCCKCAKEMSRETFSVEHLVPWLDSDKPTELFFDLNNIGFSHKLCNIKDARKPHKKLDREAYAIERRKKNTDNHRIKYCPDKRKKKYQETGH